jgi:MinD superfamily P-loop ATPase
MVHARLGAAQENSGKLVSLVRREAKALSVSNERSLLIADGSPGIGCPVIASLPGARFVLIVTEPTLSGLHDLCRVADLCKQFGVTTGVCINKADINPEVSDAIEAEASRRQLRVVGRIRYDQSVTLAQVRGTSVVELGDSKAAQDIREVWMQVRDLMG